MVDRILSEITLAFLLMAAVRLEASNPRRNILLLTTVRTGSEARLTCQQKYVDLVPVDLGNNVWMANYLRRSDVQKVWVGENKDSRTCGKNSTRERNETQGNPHEKCVLLDSTSKQVFSSDCSKKLPFVCLIDNLVLVNETKTWEDAVQHCKDLETQCYNSKRTCEFKFSLLSLSSQQHYDYVRKRMNNTNTDEVWTGLRFLAGKWFWQEGQELKEEGKLPRCAPQGKHCGTLSRCSTSNWIIGDCSERRPFFCVRKP